MLRVVLINLLMFALPFLVYWIYFYLVRSGDKDSNMLNEAPILWLLGAGGALVLIVLVSLVSFSGGEPGGSYFPSRLEDGVIKPGGFE